jgi:hypothetical protein
MMRAQHRFLPKYATIIREGAVGSVFHVLLKGAVEVLSLRTAHTPCRPPLPHVRARMEHCMPLVRAALCVCVCCR